MCDPRVRPMMQAPTAPRTWAPASQPHTGWCATIGWWSAKQRIRVAGNAAWVLSAVSGRGSGTLRSPGRARAARMPVRRWTRAGATDSHGGDEGAGARGIAYGAIGRSG